MITMRRRSARESTAAAVAVIAVLLGACSDTATTTVAEPQDPPTEPPADLQPTRLDHLAEGTALAPGVYALSARAQPDMPLAVLEVPAGFKGGGDFLFATGDAFAALAYWKVKGIYNDPCTKRGGMETAGPTVDDLAALLASQSTLAATTPVPVSIGGHQGLYLEMTVPHLDYHKCKQNDVGFWLSERAGDLYSDTPGALVRTWVLDVDGARAVLNTYTEPGATEKQLEGLNQVVESARFTSTGGSAS
jgi:hypothetical protein